MKAASGLDYRADIDGLRAVAVLAVVGYHAFPAAVPGGFVGVDVFFVISGYLITSILLQASAGDGVSFARFYVRRARRLFPALALVLAACLAAGWFLLAPADYAALGRHAVASALFVANLAFWRETDYFAAAADTLPLLHLWSLGIEEQFYLLWPALLVAARRWGIDGLRLTLGLALASLAAALWLTPSDPAAAFYLPLTRFWELLAGAAVAHLHASGRMRTLPSPRAWLPDAAAVAGLALVVGACLGLDDGAPFPGWRALWPVAGAVLLVASGPGTRVARMLSLRAMVWIGLVSYPLYLWHWPLLSFARIEAGGELPVAMRWLLLVASLALAAATWALVERPLRWRMAPRRALPLLAAAMAAVVAAGCAVVASEGVASRVGDPVRAYASYRYDFRTASREGTCSLIGAAGEPADFPAGCVDPPRDDGAPFVVLWGDSHAAMLYPGLRQAGAPLRIAQFTRSGCRPFLDGKNPDCTRSNAAVLRRIADAPPDYVVLFAHWNHLKFTGNAGMLADLEPTIAALTRLGVGRIVVVGPAPRWHGQLPANIVRLHAERPFLRLPEYTRYRLDPAPIALDAFLRERLGPRDDLTYVSAIGRLCDDRGCLTYVGDTATPTTWDYGHLTGPAAILLAAAIAEAADGFPPTPRPRPARGR